jgi:hypothetical protein
VKNGHQLHLAQIHGHQYQQVQIHGQQFHHHQIHGYDKDKKWQKPKFQNLVQQQQIIQI